LLAEATLAVNLRHLEKEPLDPETSPWPLLVSAAIAFLRHNLTAYDERLRARCERDLKYRDALAAQVTAAAYRKYPWLRDDPRPFPDPETSPVPLFTAIARDLAHQHGVRDQIRSAIRDLKREGKLAQGAALTKMLAGVEESIARDFKTLTAPKHSRGVGGGFCRTFGFNHRPEELGRYCFLDDRPITPNRYDYQGFRCPECGVSIARLKQPRDFGQGFKVLLYSCHCRALAIVQPPDRGRIAPLTAEDWECACGT
jgi:predicted RNA-binding Zn-ribbon protein involved in translation (DUF1610 family)